jgi:hypothetical protein
MRESEREREMRKRERGREKEKEKQKKRQSEREREKREIQRESGCMMRSVLRIEISDCPLNTILFLS